MHLTTPSSPVRHGAASLGLTAKMVITLTAVVWIALTLSSTLNALRFEQSLRQVTTERLEVMVQEAVSAIEQGLDLGLSIEAMPRLEVSMRDLTVHEAGLTSIVVHTCDGEILLRSHPDRPLATLEPARLESPQAGGRVLGRRIDPSGVTLGRQAKDSSGECAAGVAVIFDAEGRMQLVAQTERALFWLWAMATLLIVPAVLVLRWMLRQHERALCVILDDLSALGHGAPTNGLVAGQSTALVGEQEHELMVRYRLARPVLQAVAQGLVLPPSNILTGDAPDNGRRASTLGCADVAPRQGWWRRNLGDPVIAILGLTALTLLIALAVVGAMTAGQLRSVLMPELARKGDVQAMQVQRLVARALDVGVPMQALTGLPDLFKGMASHDRDLAFLAVTDGEGRLVQVAGLAPALFEDLRLVSDPLPPVLQGLGVHLSGGYVITKLDLRDATGQARATVYLGQKGSAMLRPLRENLADLLIVFIVSLCLGFEVMLFVVTVNFSLPLQTTLHMLRDIHARRFAVLHDDITNGTLGRIARQLNALVRQAAARLSIHPRPVHESRLIGVRLLAFLFVLAEELARPVMPLFFSKVAQAGGGAGLQMGAGTVMTVHMAVVALTMPLASIFCNRIGRKRLYLGGALLATVGLIGTGQCENVPALLLCRALSGMGYAATFVACQAFVIESTGKDNRARGTALMVSGITLADICGPAIGGIVSDWLGPSLLFALGGATAGLAALLLSRLMGPSVENTELPPRLTLKALTGTLFNGAFVSLLLLAAVPAKLVLGGLLYFLVPLALQEFGANASQVGRTIVLYGLTGLVAGPLFARLTDRLQRPLAAVVGGGVLTAVGAMPLLHAQSVGQVALAVLALGLGQALSIPALMTAALSVSQPAVQAHGTGPVLAVFRLVERLGGACGPLLASLLSTAYGVRTAMSLLGCYALASVLLLLAVRAWPRGSAPAIDHA